MISQDQARELLGVTVRSTDGDKLGKIGQIFLDDQSGQPEWATVSTGLFGSRESFLPLTQIQIDGTQARVPYARQTVNDAPNVEAEGGHLSQQEEAELYRYYGLTYSEGTHSPPGADKAMSRSAEHRSIGPARRAPGRARLRRYLVSE